MLTLTEHIFAFNLCRDTFNENNFNEKKHEMISQPHI